MSIEYFDGEEREPLCLDDEDSAPPQPPIPSWCGTAADTIVKHKKQVELQKELQNVNISTETLQNELDFNYLGTMQSGASDPMTPVAHHIEIAKFRVLETLQNTVKPHLLHIVPGPISYAISEVMR